MLEGFERHRFDQVTRLKPAEETRINIQVNSEMRAFYGSFALLCQNLKDLCRKVQGIQWS